MHTFILSTVLPKCCYGLGSCCSPCHRHFNGFYVQVYARLMKYKSKGTRGVRQMYGERKHLNPCCPHVLTAHFPLGPVGTGTPSGVQVKDHRWCCNNSPSPPHLAARKEVPCVRFSPQHIHFNLLFGTGIISMPVTEIIELPKCPLLPQIIL